MYQCKMGPDSNSCDTDSSPVSYTGGSIHWKENSEIELSSYFNFYLDDDCSLYLSSGAKFLASYWSNVYIKHSAAITLMTNALIDIGWSTGAYSHGFMAEDDTILTLGENSKLIFNGELGEEKPGVYRNHGHVWMFLYSVKMNIAANTTWACHESSAISFEQGSVSIGSSVSMNFGNNSIFSAIGTGSQPSLTIKDGVKFHTGINSNLEINRALLSVDDYANFSTGKSSTMWIGPGNFKQGPKSEFRTGSHAIIEVFGKIQEDSLVLHDNAKLELASASIFTLGNSSIFSVFPGKTVSLVSGAR